MENTCRLEYRPCILSEDDVLRLVQGLQFWFHLAGRDEPTPSFHIMEEGEVIVRVVPGYGHAPMTLEVLPPQGRRIIKAGVTDDRFWANLRPLTILDEAGGNVDASFFITPADFDIISPHGLDTVQLRICKYHPGESVHRPPRGKRQAVQA
jgi:hypothetical protein